MRKLIMLAVVLACGLLLISCNQNKASDDRAEIEALINGTYAYLFNGDGATGNGNPGNSVPNSIGGTATQPQLWWRSVETYNRTINIDFPSDGHADVEVEDVYNGRLHVDRSHDFQLNPGVRNWTCRRLQYCTFNKAGENWYMTGISLGRWLMNSDSQQMVQITSLRVQGANYDKTFTDPYIIIPWEELPTLAVNSNITVTMVVTNSSSSTWVPKTFGYLHYTPYNRDPMGEQPTGTFTDSCPASGDEWGYLAGDAVDSSMLQTESGTDYNWDIWGLPFKIQQ
jgi:hypothetical protein